MQDNSTFVIRAKNLAPFTQSRFYHWIILALCASLLFYKYVLNVSPSIMTQELMSYFHLTGTQLSNLAATFFYTYTITQLCVGVIVDRWGIRFLTSFAMLVSASGVLLFSTTHQLWVAALGRSMMGFGAAFATVVYLKTTTQWFNTKNSALITGLLPTAVMLGAVFGEAPLAHLVNLLGWQKALWFCSMVGVVIAVLFFVFVQEHSLPKESGESRAPENKLPFWQGIKVVFRNPHNWILTAYAGLAFVPLGVFAGLWGVTFLQEAYHLPKVSTAGLVSIMFVGLGAGGPLFGWLSDLLQQRRSIMLVGLTLSFVTLLPVLYLTALPLWLLSGLLFLFGLGTGAFMLCFTVGRNTNPLTVTATVMALINSGDLLSAVTEPLVGKLLDLGWNGTLVEGARHFTLQNYHWAFLPLPLYLLLALVLLLFIRDSNRAPS